MSQLDLDLKSGADPGGDAVLSVAELTRKIRLLLEGRVGSVWVGGEVSNLRRQASGHTYFTLKDSDSELSCVLFASQAAQIRDTRLSDGQEVELFGNITLYEKRGQYQLVVRKARLRGQGQLQARFEELKRKLQAEGMFEAARKRPIPRFPARIGVVTSPTGAAIRDFLNVLHRRNAGIAVLINPARVQGTGAANEIAAAIQELGDPSYHVDVVVVTRGGGSIEDLWEFNEEVVARAVASSRVPVVSAIGHEIDFTITDFAADMRAPTPSAAAELLSASRADVLERLTETEARMRVTASTRIKSLRERLVATERAALSLGPQRVIDSLRQTLDRADDALYAKISAAAASMQHIVEVAAARLAAASPLMRIARAKPSLQLAIERMRSAAGRTLAAKQAEAARLQSVLAALNPDAALARGYSVTLLADGRTLRSAADAHKGEVLMTRLADGTIRSIVSDESP